MPFVFALWVIQRRAVDRWNGSLEAALATLTAAKSWGSNHLDIICRQATERGILNSSELRDYYEALGFNLHDKEKQGLELFFHYLLQVGEVSEVPRLDVYSPLAYVA